MKLKDKIHANLQGSALEKAIIELIGTWGDYYIDDVSGDIIYKFKNSKLSLLENLEFNLPSIGDIKESAKKYYKNFDDSWMKNIRYYIDLRNKPSMCGSEKVSNQNLKLNIKDSYLYLSYSWFDIIDIVSQGNVIITDCFANKGATINSKSIVINQLFYSFNNEHTLKAEYVEFNHASLKSNKIDVDAKLISFNNSSFLGVDDVVLKSEMIDSIDSSLKAQKRIEITNNNCDAIEGVDAPVIIYNGQDITYSYDIVMPKLRKQLLSHLREIKNNVVKNIDNEVEELQKKQKESLEKKPITKILKK